MSRCANAGQRSPRHLLLTQNQQVVERPLVIGTHLRCRLGGGERRVDSPQRLPVLVGDTVCREVVRGGVTMHDDSGDAMGTVCVVQMLRRQQRLAEHAQHGKAHERPPGKPQTHDHDCGCGESASQATMVTFAGHACAGRYRPDGQRYNPALE